MTQRKHAAKTSYSEWEYQADPALAEALAAARRGWPVFPVHGIGTDGQCTCCKADCDRAGKHPRLKGYAGAATADPERIEQRHTRWPDCNWGLLTGARSGVIALDVDPRHGGEKTLARLQLQYGKLPPTVRALSGGGGRHELFKHPGPGVRVKNKAHALGDGLDMRGEGGLIVCPGSVHKSGRRYTWDKDAHPETAALAPLPQWMRDLLGRSDGLHEGTGDDDIERTERTERGAGLLPCSPSSSILSISLPEAVAEAIRVTLPQGVGQRNLQLFEYARALKAIPALADAAGAHLREYVRLWHTAALPFIGTTAFEDTWADFLYGWGRVRTPRGEGLMEGILARADASNLPAALEGQYDAPATHRLIKLCRELQAACGTDPFFLACQTVHNLLGLENMTAWRRLKALVADGVLQVVKPGTEHRATRYRYLAG